MIGGREKLLWYCHLVLSGYSSKKANEILDKAIKEYEQDKQASN